MHDPGPYNLATTPLILSPSMGATPKLMGPRFFEELDVEFGGFAGHVLVMQHTFDQPWPTWEMHPAGDETVCLLSGDTDFVLRMADGERTVRVNEPGQYVVVPRGVWHTARPCRETTMLFVTPGQGTQNLEQPPA